MSESQDESETPPEARLLILYGTQTGTAQDVAEFVAREAWRRHLNSTVLGLDQYDISQLPFESSPIIFVVATTGNGDPPTNMLAFWRFLLRADLPPDSLSNLRCTVFGLGDSGYERFCWMARKLWRRLEGLSADLNWMNRGEGDEKDENGLDTALHPWLESLWTSLGQIFPQELSQPVIAKTVRPPPKMSISFLSKSSATPMNVEISSHSNPQAHQQEDETSCPEGWCWARLSKNERVTAPDHFQDVREMEFDLEDEMLNDYSPGSVLSVQPQNPPEDVESFLNMMGWKEVADTPIRVASSNKDFKLSPPLARAPVTTLRHLFTSHFDIFSVPRRSFFEWLAHFTTDEVETEKLKEFSEPGGEEDRYDYADRPRRTIYEVLYEFRSARGKDAIPLDYLGDLFPEIRSRQFSISSSSKVHQKQVHILVAIVKYRMKAIKAPRRGVCTTWLSRLKPGVRIPVSIQSGTMTLPPTTSSPIILIGPGTGVAPFRAFLEDRDVGGGKDNTLFFGCRSRFKDFYYNQQWEGYKNKGSLWVDVAASRDQDDKIYVQHRIREHADHIRPKLLDPFSRVYICGSSNHMPKAVKESLRFVLRSGNFTEIEATAHIAKMETEGRLQEETW